LGVSVAGLANIARAIGANSSALQNVTIVIEVKGCWNADVRTAVKWQLVDGYLRPNGLTHGIYLAGWFVCEKWDNSRNQLLSKTLAYARHEIKEITASYDGMANPERVAAVLLDCGYPESIRR
jgi:hypothetical protein